MFSLRTAALAVGLCRPFPLASAQIDYQNLQDDRPGVAEDAYPVEAYGLELLAASRSQAEANIAHFESLFYKDEVV